MSLREKGKKERIAENYEKKKKIINKKSVIEIFFGLPIASKGKLRLRRDLFFNLIFVFQLIWGFLA